MVYAPGGTSWGYNEKNSLGMFYDILDAKRRGLLPLLKPFRDRFYLAGGTGLALQLGHRDSADFDFFTPEHFDTGALYRELFNVFRERKIIKTFEEKDTLTVVIYEEIRLSFFQYPYPLINAPVEEENLRVASIEDIACMKLSAVVSRALEKDFVDLYFILKQMPLAKVLEKMIQKMPDLDQNLVLKSLVYFDDVVEEKILFKHGFDVALEEVKKSLEEQVKKLR